MTASAANNMAGDCAITAFSGGVDSCFTCVRHAERKSADYRSIPLKAGLMIHGFDIPDANVRDYEGALEKCRHVLASHGLQCMAMKTDLRKLCGMLDVHFSEETHGTFLAACLLCYENVFSMAVIPSTYAYNAMRFPWGSTPMTDALLGTRQMPVVHDGAAFNKLQKVEWFANDESIAHSLRVCWEGHRFDSNCGKCFKCVATQICYWLCDVSSPPCFPVSCSLAEVEMLHLSSDQNRYLFRCMASRAKDRGFTDIRRSLDRCLEGNDAPARGDRARWLTQRWLRLGRRVMPSRW